MFILSVRKLKMQLNNVDNLMLSTLSSHQIHKNSRKILYFKENLKLDDQSDNIDSNIKNDISQLRRHTSSNNNIKKSYSITIKKNNNSGIKTKTKFKKSCSNNHFDQKESAIINSSYANVANFNYSESMKNEMKALNVLGIVFISFIIAWLPLCLINIGSVIYFNVYKKEIEYFIHFLNFFTYLGYISSTFNPIIYTAFNRRFRQNFYQIITCTNKKKRSNSNYKF